MRFKKFEAYQSYFKNNDMDYYTDDSLFTGFTYKTKTPEFDTVNLSEYARGTDYKQNFGEVFGNNCYISTNG